MANSKIRLQIVTALDNAGIKATKDQVAQLESQLVRTGSTGGKAGDMLGVAFKGAMSFIKGAAGGLALFWGAGPKLFKFFEDVQSNSEGMAEGVKNAFENMSKSIGSATLEHFGVFKQLDEAAKSFKGGLDIQINGVDKMVEGTKKLQENLNNNLSLFEHIANTIYSIENSMSDINDHAAELSQKQSLEDMKNFGATKEERKAIGILFDIDKVAEKQRNAIRARDKKLYVIDTQIDKAQADAEMQAELVEELQKKVNSAMAVEKQFASYDPNKGRDIAGSEFTFWDDGLKSLIAPLFDELVGEKVKEEQDKMLKAQVEQRRRLEDRLTKARETLKTKTDALDKLDATRLKIDAQTSKDVRNASNDLRAKIMEYDHHIDNNDPLNMTGLRYEAIEEVISGAMESLDFDIPNKHLERIEKNTDELAGLMDELRELLAIKR